jgi:integrase
MKQIESDETKYEKIGEHVAIYQRGQRWYANYQFNGKQIRQSLRTTSKKQARTKAIQIEADLTSGRFTEQKRAPSLQAVIDRYRDHLVTEGRAKKTLAKYEHAFGVYLTLAERLKVKNILGVNQTFVDAFRAERVANGAAPKTVHNDTVTLRQIVNFAISRGLIQRDPLHGLKISKPKPRPQPCWTYQEVRQILAASREPQRSALTLLAETGMRIGELRHLTWADIDFTNGVIHVREKPGWKPKTGDMRVIPMSTVARDVLAQLPRGTAWVFLAKPSRRAPEGERQISERRLLQYLKRVLKKLSLPGHLHTFRHYFISHALTNGVPEAVVRQWVGHVDRDVIQRYTHVADSISKAAMADLAANTHRPEGPNE